MEEHGGFIGRGLDSTDQEYSKVHDEYYKDAAKYNEARKCSVTKVTTVTLLVQSLSKDTKMVLSSDLCINC